MQESTREQNAALGWEGEGEGGWGGGWRQSKEITKPLSMLNAAHGQALFTTQKLMARVLALIGVLPTFAEGEEERRGHDSHCERNQERRPVRAGLAGTDQLWTSHFQVLVFLICTQATLVTLNLAWHAGSVL